jgi:thiol peroxidase
MSSITFKGNPIETVGDLPKVGDKAPDFRVTDTDLADKTLADFAGKKVILNIFPSVDTGICAASVREFNKRVGDRQDATVLCISKDLPFAHKRFCGAEGIEGVISASQYKDQSFSENYRVDMLNGPLAGLMSRAVVVVDENGVVSYVEQVPEIVQEPDYEAALASLG